MIGYYLERNDVSFPFVIFEPIIYKKFYSIKLSLKQTIRKIRSRCDESGVYRDRMMRKFLLSPNKVEIVPVPNQSAPGIATLDFFLSSKFILYSEGWH